jgi:hypothetical protein
MYRNLARAAVAVGCLGALIATATSTAVASPARHTTAGFAHLAQLNGSGVKGTARLTVHDNWVEVTVFASGLLRNAPHAMHFHAGGAGRCPTMAADANGDGIVSTTEGHHAYGMIITSLTVSGDTSPASGLAVDRFAATPYGYLTYHRRMMVDGMTAGSIRAGNAVLVIHGIDPNGSGTYDGTAPSDLDPKLPLEATSPATCGVINTHDQR